MSDERRPDFHFELSGDPNAAVQAATVYGGIHINPGMRVSPPRQLTHAPEYYTNNEDELDELTRILGPGEDHERCRLAAVRGEPGSGRTAFASHFGMVNEINYPDGLFYVSLSGFTDPSGALDDLLRTVGYVPDQIPPTLAGRAAFWRSWTAGKRLLTVIDDVIQSADVTAFLPGPGPSAVLAVPVHELAGVRGQVSLSPLNDDQSFALLTRRLGDRITDEPEAARKLVQQCWGSAAALNVAADLLIQDEDSVTELVRQLERRGPLRHLKMGAVFDTAYDRLPERARLCYRALGAHPGEQPIVSEMALAEATGLDIDDVYDVMRILSRASLVARLRDGRYRLTHLLSVHAAAKAEAGDGQELRAGFLRHYRDHGLRCAETITPNRAWLAERIEPLAGSDAKPTARAWLAEEEPNLAEAVRVADDRTSVELCLALWPLYIRGGRNSARMIEMYRIGVARAAVLGDDQLLSVMHTQLGFAYREQREWSKGADEFTAAQHTESVRARASAIEGFGLMRREQGDDAGAETLLRLNVALASEVGASPRRLAMATFHLATVLPSGEALPMLALAREYFDSEGEHENVVKIDLWRGRKLLAHGDSATAAPILAQAARSAGQIKAGREHGQIMLALADADPANAATHLNAALKIFALSGFVRDIVAVRTRMAELGIDPDRQH